MGISAHARPQSRFATRILVLLILGCALPLDVQAAPPFETVTPDKIQDNRLLFLNVSQGTLLKVGGRIKDVDIADERICRRVLRSPTTGEFEVVGVQEGITTATVWFDATASLKPIIVKIIVGVDPTNYDRMADFIRTTLDPDGKQKISLRITAVPISGKILVEGKLKCCEQLQEVRSYIEGAVITPDRLVYKVEVEQSNYTPCCCCRRHKHK